MSGFEYKITIVFFFLKGRQASNSPSSLPQEMKIYLSRAGCLLRVLSPCTQEPEFKSILDDPVSKLKTKTKYWIKGVL